MKRKIGVVMPLEKKYENNADIAAQQNIEIGNVFNIV